MNMNIYFLQLFVCGQNDTRMHQGFNPYPFLVFPLAIKDWGQDCASDIDFVLLFTTPDPADPSPDAFKELWKTTEEQLAGWDMDPGVPVTLSRGRFGLVASLSEDLQIEVSCGETALGPFFAEVFFFTFHGLLADVSKCQLILCAYYVPMFWLVQEFTIQHISPKTSPAPASGGPDPSHFRSPRWPLDLGFGVWKGHPQQSQSPG